MSAGERAGGARRRAAIALFAGWLALHGAPARAIDNPDAPDWVAEFESRAGPHAAAVGESARTDAEIARAYGDYERFLDAELNRAYRGLLDRLNGAPRSRLTAAQKRWLQFRDAEFQFIDSQSTPQQFGSSYRITRGAGRVQLLRDRVIELLRYRKNY